VKIYPGLWQKKSITLRVFTGFAAECYLRFTNDTVAPHDAGIEESYNGSKICSEALHSGMSVLVAVGWVISVCGVLLSLF
jgi:hypothetical protein